ncbi:MAG: RidA family protein [Propionivibrio sp.]
MEREIVATAGAPAAIGAYVQATLFERLVFTSGQIPLDPVSMAVVEGGVVEQTEQVMKNLFAVLEAAGSNAGQVLKTTCYLSDMGDFAAFNEIYARYFGETPPARSCVQAAALPRGVKVEVEAIAWR